jgi:Ca2+-binding EF-hand superfamily protein
MKIALVTLTAALLSTGALANDNETTNDTGKDRNDAFATLDSDSDGKLSKDEVSGSASLSSSFSMIDRNSDGYISRGEYRRNTMPKSKRD